MRKVVPDGIKTIFPLVYFNFSSFFKFFNRILLKSGNINIFVKSCKQVLYK